MHGHSTGDCSLKLLQETLKTVCNGALAILLTFVLFCVQYLDATTGCQVRVVRNFYGSCDLPCLCLFTVVKK